MDTTTEPIPPNSRGKRQWRTTAEKRSIVEETLVPGVSVAQVARAHGINDNQVFHWRKLYRAGLLVDTDASGTGGEDYGLIPVQLVDHNEAEERRGRQASVANGAAGVIELRLPKGQIRIVGVADADLVRLVDRARSTLP